MSFWFDNDKHVKRFKEIFPAIIAAAVRGGNELWIYDCKNEHLNKFVVNEIEKAGILIDYLSIKH